MTDTSEEHAQIVVDLGCGAHGRAGVAGDDFLFDGDGWRNTTDEVTLGFVHATEELAGIARQTLHITPLTFGIQGVEGQR